MVDANTILSGLFFRGNERHLLRAALRHELRLIFPEDVVDEVYEVIERDFSRHGSFGPSLGLLEDLFAVGELVARETYRDRVHNWTARLRDPSDSPVLACAEAVGVDTVVTGDKDLLELEDTEGIHVVRTREVLRELR